MPTALEIRAMDGLALTELAYALGLAPEDVGPFCLEGDSLYDHGRSEFWEPHIYLAQADAVLRKLRELCWDTHVQYFVKTHTGQIGVWRCDEHNKLHGDIVQWHDKLSEADALLRAACLAVASMQDAA